MSCVVLGCCLEVLSGVDLCCLVSSRLVSSRPVCLTLSLFDASYFFNPCLMPEPEPEPELLPPFLFFRRWDWDLCKRGSFLSCNPALVALTDDRNEKAHNIKLLQIVDSNYY